MGGDEKDWSLSISDGILVDRCFRICMSEAGTHQSSLGSQQIRTGTVPPGRLMCTLGSIKQRSSGPSCAHAEGMHRSHVLPHSCAAFRPTARLPTVSAFSFINSDRRSPTCTMLVLLLPLLILLISSRLELSCFGGPCTLPVNLAGSSS